MRSGADIRMALDYRSHFREHLACCHKHFVFCGAFYLSNLGIYYLTPAERYPSGGLVVKANDGGWRFGELGIGASLFSHQRRRVQGQTIITTGGKGLDTMCTGISE